MSTKCPEYKCEKRKAFCKIHIYFANCLTNYHAYGIINMINAEYNRKIDRQKGGEVLKKGICKRSCQPERKSEKKAVDTAEYQTVRKNIPTFFGFPGKRPGTESKNPVRFFYILSPGFKNKIFILCQKTIFIF